MVPSEVEYEELETVGFLQAADAKAATHRTPKETMNLLAIAATMGVSGV